MQVSHGSQRNYALDFLKGVATITIVFHHYQRSRAQSLLTISGMAGFTGGILSSCFS